jgi:hypothetical protein
MAKDLDYLTNVVDKNGASNSKTLSQKKKRSQTGNIPDDTTPIDYSEDNQPSPNQKKPDAKTIDYSFAFGKTEKDYSVGRDAYMATIDDAYERLSISIKEDHKSGGYTKTEYVAYMAALQKAWKQAHIDADKYYSQKEGA